MLTKVLEPLQLYFSMQFPVFYITSLKTMLTEIITSADLQVFKLELLEDIRKLLSERQSLSPSKWLKAKHVRKLLSVSPGTLQQLRVNGTLPFSKIGGVIYYDAADIEKMFNDRKHNPVASRKIKSKLKQ